MKTNITKLATLLFAHIMAVAVVLAHTHVGDVVKHSSTDLGSYTVRSSVDVNAKALGDLHNHIDKTMLKNVLKSAGDSTAATRRDLKQSVLVSEESLLERFTSHLLFLQVLLTIRV